MNHNLVGAMEDVRAGIRAKLKDGTLKDGDVFTIEECAPSATDDTLRHYIISNLNGYVGAANPPEIPATYSFTWFPAHRVFMVRTPHYPVYRSYTSATP